MKKSYPSKKKVIVNTETKNLKNYRRKVLNIEDLKWLSRQK